MQEGSTVVSTVKDTRAATSTITAQRLQINGRAILRHGPNINYGRCGMTARHLPAKTAQATPAACTTETVILPLDAATLRPVGLRAGGRLKNGSCEDDEPSVTP